MNVQIEKCKEDILWVISKGADANHKSIEDAYGFSSNQYDSKILIEEMKDVLRPFQINGHDKKVVAENKWWQRFFKR
ncbi:MAG: hypothetical protein IPH89_16050 [Bacteroidetes bacterium]|nr:hypothetical protein [Bacteroidota bacterium]